MACAICFTLGRLAHTFCYVYQLMPWRTIAWAVGLISVWVSAFNLVAGAYKDNN